MIKARKITYKVFLFDRVKKKRRFFNTETYPLQIRLTAGARSLYLKSYFFTTLLQSKYQHEILFNEKQISIDDIIVREEELIQYILTKKRDDLSLDNVRKEYSHLSFDILHAMDEQFKKFLVDFFYAENLPAYALFIKNDGKNHTSEFILKNLEMSLQPVVFNTLLQAAVDKAPPYIPLIKFFREKVKNPLPVFPVYQWQQPAILKAFADFVDKKFPEYKLHPPANYIEALLNQVA